MRGPALCLALALFVASPSLADCPWQDDADRANALSDSRWQLTSKGAYRVRDTTLRMDKTPRSLELVIGPVLRDVSVDGTSVELKLASLQLPETHTVDLGRNKVTFGYPDLSGAACVARELSMLRAIGQTRIDGRMATLTLDLWPASATRLAGLMRVERIDAFNRLHARYETIEASPLP